MEFTFGDGIWSATAESESEEREREGGGEKLLFAMYQSW